MSEAPKTINEQACEWIAKINSGEPSVSEREQLKGWMRQAPEHEAEIKKMARLWDELNVLTELAVSVDVPRATPLNSAAASFKSVLAFWQWPAGAMVSVVLLSALTLLSSGWYTNHNGIYTTKVGEQRLVTFSDNSTMLLNTSSRVSVQYSQGDRTLYLLQGEAHFDVTPNPERPFYVYAGKSLSRAVGTAFSVYLRDDAIELTVTEGRVAFNAAHQGNNIVNSLSDNSSGNSSDGSSISASSNTVPAAVSRSVNSQQVLLLEAPLVEANQRALFNQVAEVVEKVETISPSELARGQAWRSGTLRFAGDTLEEVITEVSRYTALSIVIVDPQLRGLRIGGLFKVGETDKMLRVLESNFGVRVKRIGETVVHLSSVSWAEQ